MATYKPDLNTATKEELERIPDISEETAEAIIRYRKEKGCIADFDELMNVDGITQSHIDHLRPWMRIEEK